MKVSRKKHHEKAVSVRLPRALADAVDRYSSESGLSYSEIMRGAVARQLMPMPADREMSA